MLVWKAMPSMTPMMSLILVDELWMPPVVVMTAYADIERAVQAVRRAAEAARPGEVVLLSPACASYDQFRDYEKRGTHFRQMVGVITGCDPCDDTASRSILP